MIGICGEPLCPCRQIRTPEPVALKSLKVPADQELSKLSDHELRWAIRDGIARMYKHLGLDELTAQAAYHLGIEPLGMVDE